MKKLFFVVSLIATLGAGFAHAQSDPIDLVVLVDTSESMLPYWKDTTDYIIKNILTGVLHTGDTFHLISFASRPELEISRKIESEKDIRAILARFLLLQPLGRYTDLVSAIQYLYQYVIDLPLSTQKRIIILTDGIHDPPPDSSFPIKYGPNGQDISGNKQQIVETAQAMRRHGWEVHIVQYPLEGTPTPGSATEQPGTQLLGTGQPAGASSGGPQGGPGAGTASNTTGKSGGGPAGSAGQTSATGSSPGASTGGGKGGVSTGSSVGVVGGASTAGGAAPGAGQQPGAGQTAGGSRGENGLLNDLSQTLGVPIQQFESGNKQNLANIAAGSPAITFPKSLGNVGYETTIPFVVRNFEDRPILVQLSGIISNGVNILRRPVNQPVGARKEATLKAPIQLPVSLTPGAHTIDIELQFTDSLRVSPHTGQLSFTLKKGIIDAQGVGFYALPVLFGIVLLAVVVLIVIFIRRIVGNLGTAPAASISPRVRFDGAHAGIHAIELRVRGQNPNIGGRNIHPIGPGARRTVGGGGSSFLIYLYPCPAHIGEIAHDGERYTFIPTKPEFFPGLSGELHDCIDREIRVRPNEHHEVTLVFRRYVSPLDEVNRIMHLVDKPGLPSGEAT